MIKEDVLRFFSLEMPWEFDNNEIGNESDYADITKKIERTFSIKDATAIDRLYNDKIIRVFWDNSNFYNFSRTVDNILKESIFYVTSVQPLSTMVAFFKDGEKQSGNVEDKTQSLSTMKEQLDKIKNDVAKPCYITFAEFCEIVEKYNSVLTKFPEVYDAVKEKLSNLDKIEVGRTEKLIFNVFEDKIKEYIGTFDNVLDFRDILINPHLCRAISLDSLDAWIQTLCTAHEFYFFPIAEEFLGRLGLDSKQNLDEFDKLMTKFSENNDIQPALASDINLLKFIVVGRLTRAFRDNKAATGTGFMQIF